MSTVQLKVNEFGHLCTAREDIQDKPLRDVFPGDPVLVCRYEEGDCDVATWPMTEGMDRILDSALFDAREMGMIPDCNSVLLPDGKEWVIGCSGLL